MMDLGYWWTTGGQLVGNPLSLVLLTSGIHPACSGDAW